MADEIRCGAAEPGELSGASLPDDEQTRLFPLCGLDETASRVTVDREGLVVDSQAAEHAAAFDFEAEL